MTKPLYVFYHFYVPPGSNTWICTLDQQLQAIRDSGLSVAATINMCITGDIDLNYIERRYPFVNIIDVRSIEDPNIFEGQTLKVIWLADLPDDSYILYIHSKGATSNSTYVSAWRETLNYEMITKWRKCCRSLIEYDVIGVSDTHVINTNSVITSGNFWWTTSKYIKTLSNPIDSTQYLDKHHPNDYDYRYCFERWITSNNPRLFFSCNMECNPYLEYYFVEEHI